MKNLILLSTLIIGINIFGQHNPVQFQTTLSNDTIKVEASIEKDWHLYSANLPNPNEGPLATEFRINSDHISIEGDITESEGIREMDETFGVEVIYFKDNGIFYLPVKYSELKESNVAPLLISYMVCNDQSCIPFEVEVDIAF